MGVAVSPGCDDGVLWFLQQAVVDVVSYEGATGFPVACQASFCSFLYDSTITAAVSAVSPSSISAAATSITITGTGFGTTLADVTVTLGGVACSVSSVTDTQVVCTTGDVPAGTHVPQVSGL